MSPVKHSLRSACNPQLTSRRLTHDVVHRDGARANFASKPIFQTWDPRALDAYAVWDTIRRVACVKPKLMVTTCGYYSFASGRADLRPAARGGLRGADPRRRQHRDAQVPARRRSGALRCLESCRPCQKLIPCERRRRVCNAAQASFNGSYPSPLYDLLPSIQTPCLFVRGETSTTLCAPGALDGTPAHRYQN